MKSELDKAKEHKKIIIPINFDGIPFSELIDIIIDEYNKKAPEKVDIAEEIVKKYLDDKLTYIVCRPESDRYYNDIISAIKNNAPTIEIIERNAVAPEPESAAPAPVQAEPAKQSEAPKANDTVEAKSDPDAYRVQNGEMNVTIKETEYRLVLYEGSRVCGTVDTDAPAKTKKAREQLTSAGKLTNFIVAEDIEFSNSSALASFCAGRAKSGAEFISSPQTVLPRRN